MAGMKAGVAPATIARPMQPMRISRVGAEEPVVATNGNGQWPRPMVTPTVTRQRQRPTARNGNGKGRKVKSVVTVEAAVAEPEMLVEVGGQ